MSDKSKYDWLQGIFGILNPRHSMNNGGERDFALADVLTQLRDDYSALAKAVETQCADIAALAAEVKQLRDRVTGLEWYPTTEAVGEADASSIAPANVEEWPKYFRHVAHEPYLNRFDSAESQSVSVPIGNHSPGVTTWDYQTAMKFTSVNSWLPVPRAEAERLIAETRGKGEPPQPTAVSGDKDPGWLSEIIKLQEAQIVAKDTLIANLQKQLACQAETVSGEATRREKYAIGQHDLACEALNVGNSPDDDGDTLFEAVCLMQAELAAKAATIERLKNDAEKLEQEEADHLETIDQRDSAIDFADRLAATAGDSEVIGEHTSENCPWTNALEILSQRADELAAKDATIAEQAKEIERLKEPQRLVDHVWELSGNAECKRLKKQLSTAKATIAELTAERDKCKRDAEAMDHVRKFNYVQIGKTATGESWWARFGSGLDIYGSDPADAILAARGEVKC